MISRAILVCIAVICFCGLIQAQSVSGTVTLNANASDVTAAPGDTECGIASVQFFIGTVALGAPITTPASGNNYVLQWNTTTTANGTYAVTAKATDKAGIGGAGPATICDGSKPNVGTSNALTVTVNNPPPDVGIPTISITITP